MTSDMKVRMKQRCGTEFLRAGKVAPIDIHWHLLYIHGDQPVGGSTVRWWLVHFSSVDSVTLCTSPGRWHLLLFLYPLMLKLCHKRSPKRFVRHDLPLVKPHWLPPTTNFSFALVWSSRGSALWFCQARRWDWLACSSVDLLFFPSWKWGLCSLFQSVGASPDCHYLSNMVDSSLATSSTRFLRKCGWISVVPWTCAPSGSLGGLKADLHLQQADLPSTSSYHCFLQLVWCY